MSKAGNLDENTGGAPSAVILFPVPADSMSLVLSRRIVREHKCQGAVSTVFQVHVGYRVEGLWAMTLAEMVTTFKVISAVARR